MDRPTPAPRDLPTELREAVTAQIEETQVRLRADAAAAGVPVAAVDAAIAEAADAYAHVRVHAFLGILVERHVRETLRLGRAADPLA
ncbi:MAG: hypothetical protein NTW05_26440 [Pseudonocardiales bacterium]|nr:hypothetical protein [Pseudonocardiales bacterium]